MLSKCIFTLLFLCLAWSVSGQMAIQFTAIIDSDKSHPEIEKLGRVYIEKISDKNLYRYKLVPIYSFDWGLERLYDLGYKDAFITDHPPSGTRYKTRLAQDEGCKCLDLDILASPVCLDNCKRLNLYNVEIGKSGYCHYYLRDSKLSKKFKIKLNLYLFEPKKNNLKYRFKLPDVDEKNYSYDSSTFSIEKESKIPFIIDYYIFTLTAKANGEWFYNEDEFLVRIYDSKYIYGDIVRLKDLD